MALFYGFEASSSDAIEAKKEIRNIEVVTLEYNSPYVLTTENPTKNSQQSTIKSTALTQHSLNPSIIIMLVIGLILTVFFFSEIASRIA